MNLTLMNFLNLKTTVTCFLMVSAMLVSFHINASEDLLKQIDQIRKNKQISAAVVILVNKDDALIQGFLGNSSWENGLPLKQKNMFRIGSISKSFAGILAVKMQQLGLIDLSKPLGHYLKKEYIENNFDTEITLEQLLEHTSGLTDLSKPEWDYNKSQKISLEQALDLNLGNHVSKWQPGLHSSYSNVGVAYLGLALEKASGKTYEQLMQDYVFRPLEMKSSTLFLENHVNGRLIKGYNTDGKTLIPYWHNIYRPFAAINTDVSDMVSFLQMLLGKGMHNDQQFLTNQEITRIETPKTTLAAKSGLTYGYGLGNYQWQTNGYTFHGHGGDADGYLSRFGYNRETGLAYFVMINAFQHTALKQIRQLIENDITKDLPKPDFPLKLKLSDEILASYVGKYTKVTSRFKQRSQPNSVVDFEVINQDGILNIGYKKNRTQEIYPVNTTHFRYEDESVATMAFIEHDGKMYFQGDTGNFVKVK